MGVCMFWWCSFSVLGILVILSCVVLLESVVIVVVVVL